MRDVIVTLNERSDPQGLSLDVRRGEVLGFVGGSGQGKTVLMRTIIGLLPKVSGTIEVFGIDLDKAGEAGRHADRAALGRAVPAGRAVLLADLHPERPVPDARISSTCRSRLMDEIAVAKLEMVGLKPDVRDKYPAELSGGMIKRVALARALALDPEIVFLDEPTSGLDPIGAGDFDELIRTLQQTLGLTVYMVTHDLDSLHAICDRIAVLSDGKVIIEGPMEAMLACDHPWVKEYFRGKRSRAAGMARRAWHDR